MSRILMFAVGCSVVLALLFTLEDIPRTQASWVGLMLPVVVVVVCYWATRLFGKREKLRVRQGLTIGSSDRGSRLRWAKEGIDDRDKASSFRGRATARRSTSSLDRRSLFAV